MYAVDNASFIVLRDLLVNGEVKETMEALGLGISNRDICERECHSSLSDGTYIGGDEGDRLISHPNSSLFLTGALSFPPTSRSQTWGLKSL